MGGVRARAFAIVIIGFVFIASACASARSTRSSAFDNSFSSESTKQFQPLKTNVVAVLPLEGANDTELSDELEVRLTEQLVRALEIGSSLEVLNASDGERVRKAAAEVRSMPSPLQTKAIRFAERLSAQGVLFGVIGRYSEDTTGTQLGSNTPAGAGFKLWLVDTQTGAVLWSATFDKQQQPLSDNLLRVGQALNDGVGFVSSEQLIERGFNQAALNLEGLRQAARAEQKSGGSKSAR